MYEDLMGMEGLGAISLESLKQEAGSLAVLGASTVASAAVAAWVVDKAAGMEYLQKDGAPSTLGKIAAPAVPILVGAAVATYGRTTGMSKLGQAATDGVGLGMIAYGIAALVKNFAPAGSKWADAIPFGNVTPSKSATAGLGQNKFSISSYLGQAPSSVERLRGLGQDRFSARAQLQSMGYSPSRSLGQAPTSIETGLRGLGQAPSAIETERAALAGLASTLM